jgi:hypothetical protein
LFEECKCKYLHKKDDDDDDDLPSQITEYWCTWRYQCKSLTLIISILIHTGTRSQMGQVPNQFCTKKCCCWPQHIDIFRNKGE